MIHLKAVYKKRSAKTDTFPFNIPAIKALERVEFHQPITFLVGENGSGKSTFLEALAAGVGAITVGGKDIKSDETLSHAWRLAAGLRLVWHMKTKQGFFMRAEDFFNFARQVNRTRGELTELATRYEDELQEKPNDSGVQRALSMVLGEKSALIQKYGKNADALSHGESFMNLFQQRITPRGLYLVDEPEAALSPLRQLGLLSLLKEAVEEDCQFIIATHSPILMAFPEACILNFDNLPVAETEYHELEHVKLTRDFLNNPEAFLRHL